MATEVDSASDSAARAPMLRLDPNALEGTAITVQVPDASAVFVFDAHDVLQLI